MLPSMFYHYTLVHDLVRNMYILVEYIPVSSHILIVYTALCSRETRVGVLLYCWMARFSNGLKPRQGGCLIVVGAVKQQFRVALRHFHFHHHLYAVHHDDRTKGLHHERNTGPDREGDWSDP